jgi:hypothetical protein
MRNLKRYISGQFSETWTAPTDHKSFDGYGDVALARRMLRVNERLTTPFRRNPFGIRSGDGLMAATPLFGGAAMKVGMIEKLTQRRVCGKI